ncbi:MAG: hypothetical protein EPN47_17775 [Acidobacteria bacterium]|jgi:hypothetical protein|nr:MAG: hypothetical protein EPN47_17775 [Acidobacteriota bacterium]
MKRKAQVHRKPPVPHRRAAGALNAGMLPARGLSPLVNGYSIQRRAQKSIIVPNASRLAALQDVTVTGTLLKKQLVELTGSNQRQARLAAHNGAYTIEGDGDLHFDLGTKQLQPHIACELQNAADWLTRFQGSIGATLTVNGFFRCLFEHPGFRSNDDAHIFEIHPVRAVAIDGQMQAFDVDIPDQPSIHTWTSPHPLQAQDNKIQVRYDSASDTLTFCGMDGQDENYVSVAGRISGADLQPNSNAPATFNFDSPDIGKPLKGLCLKGTSATKQLAALGGDADVKMIALRNVDLAQALQNIYAISLLAIDIQAQ